MIGRPVKRVVIGANAHALLSEALLLRRPDLEVRGRRYTEVSEDDLQWGEAYLGFRRPPVAGMGNIRWVHCTGAGVDAWLFPEELPRDVLFTRTTESFGPMIAEWALARALAFSQQLRELTEDQQLRKWQHRDVSMLCGTRAVVVGTGDVGSHVARLFRALGCVVHGISRSGIGDPEVFASCSTPASLANEAATADWLIVTLPLTAATRGLVGRAVLESCQGAVLLNAGRGAVVDEALIPEALRKGWLRGVALDVFDVEPLPQESPLWSDPRVMISPHISGPTTPVAALDGFLACLEALERGERPLTVVDRERQY